MLLEDLRMDDPRLAIEVMRRTVVLDPVNASAWQLDMAEIMTEAVQAAENALRHVARNEDFRKFLDILIEEGKSDVLRNMAEENLSKQKTRILRDALDAIEHDSSSNELS